MELLKNIFFNTDKLVQNTTVKISYTGEFFENGSKETHIHYGFGENWEGLSDIEMEKTELGFQCEIELLGDYTTLNLCFKNENGEWDNNNGQNYVFTVESPCLDLTVTENTYSLDRPNRLRKTYLWNKKIKLTVYKILHFILFLLDNDKESKIIGGTVRI